MDGDAPELESAIPIFINRARTDTFALIHARKVLKGAEMSGGEFSFSLYEISPDGSGMTEVEHAANTGDGRIMFRPIAYRSEDFTEGNHQVLYRIAETEYSDGAMEQHGMTFDHSVKEVRVTLNKSGNDLSVTAIEYRNGDRWVNLTPTEMPVFHNKYEASGSVQVSLSKHLVGREWNLSDRFHFRLYALDHELPGNLPFLEASVSQAQPDAKFPPIPLTNELLWDGEHYAQERTVQYRIHEYVPDSTGADMNKGDGTSKYGEFMLPKDHLVTAHVSEDSFGELHITYGRIHENELDVPQFLNVAANTVFTVYKQWAGDIQKECPPPVIKLYRDGEFYRQMEETAPGVYQADVETGYVYKAVEEVIPGYYAEYLHDGYALNGETIVNHKVPVTGEKENRLALIAALMVSAAGFLLLMRKRKGTH